MNSVNISILIPTYNRPEYLEKALTSVIFQKGFSKDSLEIIISDDSTNFETQKMIQEKIIPQTEIPIVYSKNEAPLGMSQNWNHCISLAKGKYFIFLSDDDLFYCNDSLHTLYQNLKKYKKNAVYGLRKIINSTGSITETFPKQGKEPVFFDVSFQKILACNHGGFGGVLYTNFYDTFYDESIGLATDWDFHISYIKKHGGFGYINEYTFLYRIHDGRLSTQEDLMAESEKRVILKWTNSYLKYYIFQLRKKGNMSFFPFIVKILMKLKIYNFVRKFY